MSTIAGLKRALDLHSHPAVPQKTTIREKSTDRDDTCHSLSASFLSASAQFTSPRSQTSSTSSMLSHGHSLDVDTSSSAFDQTLHLGDISANSSLLDEDSSMIEEDREYFTTSRHPSPAHSTGSRASRRTRKPTSKAQALAGTKLYRSLGKKSQSKKGLPNEIKKLDESESLDSIDENVDQRSISPAGEISVPDDAESQISELDNGSEVNGLIEVHESPDLANDDSPRRSSKRARRPPTRLLNELEQDEEDNDQTSPTTTKRRTTPKDSQIANPSRLRFFVSAGQTSSGTGGVSTASTWNSSSPTDVLSSQVTTEDKIPSYLLTLKLSPEKLAIISARVEKCAEQRQSLPDTNIQPSPLRESSVASFDCNLSCLSPSDRLLAFAQVAAEMPESDNDSSSELANDIDLEELLSKNVAMFCQCRLSEQPSTTFEDGRTEKEEISDARGAAE